MVFASKNFEMSEKFLKTSINKHFSRTSHDLQTNKCRVSLKSAAKLPALPGGTSRRSPAEMLMYSKASEKSYKTHEHVMLSLLKFMRTGLHVLAMFCKSEQSRRKPEVWVGLIC